MYRYVKQVQVEQFGKEGQLKLSKARIGIIGCGGLGTQQAETLVRMGAGFLRIADYDVVEESNLHRQHLFENADLGETKVIAARNRLRRINPDCKLDPVSREVHDIEGFAEDLDLILDATDDVRTRFEINDYCVEAGLPFVYGGVAGTEGLVLPHVPGGACLRCLYPEPPKIVQTCANKGIFPPLVTQTASVQVVQAVRILLGEPIANTLIRIDAWSSCVRSVELMPREGCGCHG